MIIEAILRFIFLLLSSVISMFPSGSAPGWVSNGAGYLAQLVGYGSGLGAWLPFSLAGTVLVAVLACMGIGFLIKVVRIVASFLTAGGGSAA